MIFRPRRFCFCGTTSGPGETRAQTPSRGPQSFHLEAIYALMNTDLHINKTLWINKKWRARTCLKHFKVPTNLQLFNLYIRLDCNNTLGIFSKRQKKTLLSWRKGREGSWTCWASTTGPGEADLVVFEHWTFGCVDPMKVMVGNFHYSQHPYWPRPTFSVTEFISGPYLLFRKGEKMILARKKLSRFGAENGVLGIVFQ